MRFVRKLHLWLVIVLLVLLPVQVFLAGIGAFGSGYGTHAHFGYTAVHGVIVLILLTAAIGRLGWTQFWLALGLNVAFVVQVMLAQVGDLPAEVAALHALLGFLYWPFAWIWLLPRARERAGRVVDAPAPA